MSTENEEWRENSFNEENTGAGRRRNDGIAMPENTKSGIQASSQYTTILPD